MPTETKATEQRPAADFIKVAATWPTIREVAEAYGLAVRWVQEQVSKRRVTAIRLDVIRIDPDEWDAFLRERFRPAEKSDDA